MYAIARWICHAKVCCIAEYFTRNTTPAKPREGRFGYIWFVCDLNFTTGVPNQDPKAIHIVQVILYMDLLLTIH